jgi:hypothetical protein
MRSRALSRVAVPTWEATHRHVEFPKALSGALRVVANPFPTRANLKRKSCISSMLCRSVEDELKKSGALYEKKPGRERFAVIRLPFGYCTD